MIQPDDWIKDLSQWLRGRVVSFGVLEVEGFKCNYIVVDHNVPGAPRFFVGLDKPSGYYFISDEVPRAHRDLVLWHEMFEFELFADKGEGRCERALFYELARCPTELRTEHLTLRREMFQALIDWIESQPSGSYPEERLGEIRKTMARLVSMS